jgi:hypothetical protein
VILPGLDAPVFGNLIKWGMAMGKRVWTITVQNGWFNGDPPVKGNK